jgi:hypothetical protein
MSGPKIDTASSTGATDCNVSRRKILLGSTTLAAASLLGSAGAIKTSQAQQQPATGANRTSL